MIIEVGVSNETIDDNLLLTNMDGFEDEELLSLLKILSTKGAENKEAYYKIKEYGKVMGTTEIIEFNP